MGKPITTLTYSFRPLNVPRLLKCKRIRARNDRFETCSDVVLRYAIPPRQREKLYVRGVLENHRIIRGTISSRTQVRRLKSLEDAKAANKILIKSGSYELFGIMSDEEMQKRFMPSDMMNDELVSYGMFHEDRLVSFVSYYALTESFRGTKLRACVVLCVASSNCDDKTSLLLELIHIATRNGFDLMYSLDAMNLQSALNHTGFVRTSSERVHYYVYNYLCTPPLTPSEVGLVLP